MTEREPVIPLRYESPLGALELDLSPRALRAIRFGSRRGVAKPPAEVRDLYGEATCQLAEYFAGTRRTFELPLDARPEGTPFQQSVWEALRTIPYGQVAGYGDLARWVGRAGAARAVGQACGANRLPIVIPCHRAVARQGLGGFGGGLRWKEGLLRLEQERGGR